ncbi:MAG: hypothetical protein Q8Q67_00360 [bacterium]|nr:hypothetical protein [bacterium]
MTQISLQTKSCSYIIGSGMIAIKSPISAIADGKSSEIVASSIALFVGY